MSSGLHARVASLRDALDGALPGPLRVGLLTLTLHSTRTPAWLRRVAARPIWGRWTDAAIVVLLAVQATGMAVVGIAAWRALGATPATALNDPTNTVAIPGVNAFMPVAAAPYVVAALVVATVVHEGGHALACLHEGVDVEEWGVVLLGGVLPFAAYVLPDDALDAAPVRSRLRVYATGVLHNAIVALAAFAVLLAPVTASPLAAYGTYFGWALTGGAPPAAASVASLGALTNLCFWTALLNANFGLLNALPVRVLDGGRVLAISLRRLGERVGRPLSGRTEAVVVHGLGLAAALLVVVAVVGPSVRP